MEYTTQNLEYAVSVFYNGEQEDRAKAHAWLTVAQRVPEAWNFVWELLQPTKGTEIQFYAATTLHTKILRCWNEVPPESYTELKEKILQSVITYSKGPKIVTNRLCISLAAFILQQGSADLAEILRPLASAENTSLLLEVLTVIPEEYNSMTMGTAMRARNRVALNQASRMVLDDMLRYLQTVYNDYSSSPPSEETVHAWTCAATCAASWLTLGGEDSVESATTLPERAPLCRALHTAVQVLCTWNEAVSDTALEACEACLSAVRAAGTAGGAARHAHAARALLADLAALGEPLLAANNQPNSLNEELVSAVITCCVAVGECHARVLVEAAESEPRALDGGARRLLQLLLSAQAAPGHYPIHETRSNLVFGLWYTLQDEILNMSDSTHKINPVWHEVFTQLLLALVKKSEMPPESALSRDDQELLRCYRQDIADIVMYCFSILGESCWSIVESAFTAAESALQREAALHVFLALADAAPPNRAPPALAALLHHALELAADPARHDTRVLHTALDCLGAYAAWLSSVQSPQTAALGRECMRAAGAALQRCPAPAALALRKLCVDCTAPAAALVADIVQVAQNVSGTADAWTRRQLLSAAGAALAASEPADAAPLLAGLAHRLRHDLTAQVRSGGKCGAAECVSLMGALSLRPALAADLFRALLPALGLMPTKPDLVQPMFQILKNAVSALMGECSLIVDDLEKLIVAGFETAPCPVGLDVIKLVTVFVGGEWDGASRVVRTGIMASARAVSPAPAPAHGPAPACPLPDLAEALFALLIALTKKQPVAIDWIEDLLPDLVDLACACVRLWEAGAAGAACGWLAALAQRRAPALHARAPALTHTALRCIGGATPRNQMEPLAELLLALNRAQWPGAEGSAELGAWLRVALAHAGFPSAHATDAHKQKFIAAVLREKSSKRRLLETVQEFSLLCRGLIGTEYARQSLASKQMVA
ncbi:importin-13 isoform X1 [Maniola jurtina]|uniref:importin-13 isoform X1 n=1 Tax=Maniola jurtina TaxID=191418 RepID=UPI001E68E498|nr:importin-13 isoform X1 [Maniola jurtina]